MSKRGGGRSKSLTSAKILEVPPLEVPDFDDKPKRKKSFRWFKKGDKDDFPTTPLSPKRSGSSATLSSPVTMPTPEELLYADMEHDDTAFSNPLYETDDGPSRSPALARAADEKKASAAVTSAASTPTKAATTTTTAAPAPPPAISGKDFSRDPEYSIFRSFVFSQLAPLPEYCLDTSALAIPAK